MDSSGGTDATAPQPAVDLAEAPTSPLFGYLPLYNRAYHQSASRAFNMTRYAVDKFNMDVNVFATAMLYWHEFATRHGCRRISEAVLAAACVFLALKVEHYRVRADQIVIELFEVDPKGKGEEFVAWRQMLLEVELVLSDTLGFDFQRTHCQGQLMAWVESYQDKPASSRTAEEATLVGRLKQVANALFTFSLITPVYTKATPQKVAMAIMSTVALHSGNQEAYAHLWRAPNELPKPAELDGIMGTLMDAFAYLRKYTGLSSIDEEIKQRRRRLRRDAGSEGTLSGVFLSSSVGSGSRDASPFMRGGDV